VTSLTIAPPPDPPRLRSGYFGIDYSDHPSPVFHNVSLYAQDRWRATPRLAVTYGVRWERNSPPSDDPVPGAIVIAGVEDPRLGIAFELRQANGWETVLRGGWGIFYNLGTGPATAIGTPYTLRSLTGASYPLDAAALEPPPLVPSPPYGPFFPVQAFDPNLELPRTYQMNLTLEQALGRNQALSVSYVAALGRELLWNEILLDPNPEFARVSVTRNGASSDYNALQVHFERRFSHGLGAIASYTWSHAIDVSSSDAAYHPTAELLSLGLDRGSAAFDVRHVLTAAATYSIPAPTGGGFAGALLGNWSVDTIFRTRTAFPVDVCSGDLLGVRGYGRPDLVPGVPLYLDDPSAPGGRRFNRAAFTVPGGRQGTLGRNVLRGFPATQLDLAIRRSFDVTEKLEVQFRGEVFNVLNHPNFAAPDGALASHDFGRATEMLAQGLGGLNPVYQIGGPRSIQLALKLRF
jgi:hypothetical protein